MKRVAVIVAAVVVVVAMVGFLSAWAAVPCPCDSAGKKVGGQPRRVAKGRPSSSSRILAGIVPSAFAQAKVRVDTVTVYRETIVLRDPVREVQRETWWDRNHRWVVPVAVVGAGVVGWNLRGDGEDRVVVAGGGGDDDEGDGGRECGGGRGRGRGRK